jgi:hypothetical protein
VIAEMPIALPRTERRDRETLSAPRAELARLMDRPLEPGCPSVKESDPDAA